MKKTLSTLVLTCTATAFSVTAFADKPKNKRAGCHNLPTRSALITSALGIVDGDTYLVPGPSGTATPNGGFDLPMWVTVVNTTGTVCHVINTATNKTANGAGQSLDPNAYVGNQSWLGSRVISAQKANTANAFSLDYYSISTANLFGPAQTNNSLFGLQLSNPIDTKAAYRGNPKHYGKANDPMVGRIVGGVNVFGGGLALYDDDGKKIGAIGVSGDTSCTDHTVAWKIRENLGLDNVSRGVTTEMFTSAGDFLSLEGETYDEHFNVGGAGPHDPAIKGDEMYIDTSVLGIFSTATGWEHAECPNMPNTTGILDGTAVVSTP